MNRRRTQFFSLAITIIAFSLLVWLAAAPALTSRWKDHDIKIDGDGGEWPVLATLDDNIAVAAANDAADLYLALRRQRRNTAL